MEEQGKTKGFMKIFLFIFVFIVSFCLIKIPQIEIFGFVLFLITNLLYFVFVGKDLIDGTITYAKKGTEWYLKYATLLISMVFSFVSSIFMIMTLVTLQKKFAKTETGIRWSKPDRKKLDDTEIIFITITTFIGVNALYVYFSSDDVRKFTYLLFDTVLNGEISNWVRILFPIVIIGVGSALYGRLEMKPLEVNKYPTSVTCDPKNNASIKPFKDSFIKTFWFLFAFVMIVLARPFVEANFSYNGLYPSKYLGFNERDRTYIYGRNTAISLVSLFSLGVSSLFEINKGLKNDDEDPNNMRISQALVFVFGLPILLFAIFAGLHKNEKHIWVPLVGTLFALLGLGICIGASELFLDKDSIIIKTIKKILLMPVMRWDILYMFAKYAFGLTGLVYAGFSIREFDKIPKNDSCLYKNAHIRQLYIAFIVFLILFYTLNTLTASMLTSLVTGIMRFLVPPTLLGLSSYLVYITNYFAKMAPKLVVQ